MYVTSPMQIGMGRVYPVEYNGGRVDLDDELTRE